MFAPYIGREASARLAEWLARVVISYFLAPSRFVDLSDDASAIDFVRTFVLPAFPPIARSHREVVVMSSTEELIGRADVNDVEAILAITNTDVDEVTHAVADNADAIFTWDYTLARPALRKLYEKAKTGQWNATTDLPWETEVDQEAIVVANNDQAIARGLSMDDSYFIGSPVEKWGDKEWLDFGDRSSRTGRSASSCTASRARCCARRKIVETVPWYDAKLYASTQVMDEARHVEVFARYLDEKLTGHYPINAHLRLLLDDIVNDSRWDMTYLGMQIMVEGLALAAFGFMHQMTTEPLLKQLLRYVMSDEARHVAFGVLSLKEVYDGMSAPSSASARSSPSRPPCACATGSCRRRCGTAWASSRARSCPYVLGRPDPRRSSSRCCSRRSCPTARSSACSTPPTAGCATGSPRSASSSSRTGSTPARSTAPSPSTRRRRRVGRVRKLRKRHSDGQWRARWCRVRYAGGR